MQQQNILNNNLPKPSLEEDRQQDNKFGKLIPEEMKEQLTQLSLFFNDKYIFCKKLRKMGIGYVDRIINVKNGFF